MSGRKKPVRLIDTPAHEPAVTEKPLDPESLRRALIRALERNPRERPINGPSDSLYG